MIEIGRKFKHPHVQRKVTPKEDQDRPMDDVFHLMIEIDVMYQFHEYLSNKMVEDDGVNVTWNKMFVGLTEALCGVLCKRLSLLKHKSHNKIKAMDVLQEDLPDDPILVLDRLKKCVSEKANKLETFNSIQGNLKKLTNEEKLLLEMQLHIQKALVIAVDTYKKLWLMQSILID